MPKSYTEQERIYINNRLKEEAKKCLAQFGIKKTTVDEIVNRVKIPKGTFYLFYKSKELLLFEVILEQHDLIENELYKAIDMIDSNNCDEEQLTDLFFSFFEKAADSPILKLLNSDEIELLVRKLPQELIQEHFSHDSLMIEKIMEKLPVIADINVDAFSAAFRALYFSTLHKDELDSASYDESLRLLIRGLVLQML